MKGPSETKMLKKLLHYVIMGDTNLSEEFYYFTAHENGAILGATQCAKSGPGWLVGLV